MSPRDLLGVAVRLAGLGCLLFAVFFLYNLVARAAGIPTSTHPVSYEVQGLLLWLALGLCILAGARLIVRLAYWGDPG
jgi:hypothetical protein